MNLLTRCFPVFAVEMQRVFPRHNRDDSLRCYTYVVKSDAASREGRFQCSAGLAGYGGTGSGSVVWLRAPRYTGIPSSRAAGCTNATLYASGNLTDQLAKARLFPETFGETSRLGRHAGLLITSGLVLIIANVVDLSAIASVGSAVALMVFLLVGMAGWRRRSDTKSSPVIVALAIAATAIVLGFFAVDTLQNAPETFTAIVLLGLLAIVLDALVRRHRRTPHPPEGRPSPSPSPSG